MTKNKLYKNMDIATIEGIRDLAKSRNETQAQTITYLFRLHGMAKELQDLKNHVQAFESALFGGE